MLCYQLSISPSSSPHLSLSLSSFQVWYESQVGNCFSLFVPCTHAVTEQCAWQYEYARNFVFVSNTRGGKNGKGGGGRHSTQRMQRQQMTTRQKLSKKVFHQCLRCEFISHADVLDRKPLPGGASSSCSCCLPGLAQSTTVRTSQRVRLLPHRANTNWEYADYFCTSSTLCTLCLSAIGF